jgi:hypothetical protein
MMFHFKAKQEKDLLIEFATPFTWSHTTKALVGKWRIDRATYNQQMAEIANDCARHRKTNCASTSMNGTIEADARRRCRE